MPISAHFLAAICGSTELADGQDVPMEEHAAILRILPVNSPTMLTMHPSRNRRRKNHAHFYGKSQARQRAVRRPWTGRRRGQHGGRRHAHPETQYRRSRHRSASARRMEMVYDMSQQLPDTEGYSPSRIGCSLRISHDRNSSIATSALLAVRTLRLQ